MHYSTGRLALSKGLELKLLCSPPFQMLAIHPAADCWDVPRDLPTFVLQFLFWEIAATHYSVICIFKVFSTCYFSADWIVSVFLSLSGFSSLSVYQQTLAPLDFSPLPIPMTAEQHRHQHQSPESSTGKYSPLWTWILYFYPLFPTFKDFASATK